MNTGKTETKFLIAVIFLLAFSFNTKAQEKELNVKYIGNMGVLISSGESKLIIDALHQDNEWEFEEPTPVMVNNIISGKDVFAGMPLLLSTHNHEDHFNAELTAKFLEINNRNAVLTEQSVNDIKKIYERYSELENSISVTDNSDNGIMNFDFGDVKVKAINLSHGNETQNTGYIVELNGIKVLHVGDAMPEESNFKKYNLPDEKIDVLLLPVWFYRYQELVNSFGADQVLYVHIHPKELIKYGEEFKNLEETLTELGEEFVYTKK